MRCDHDDVIKWKHFPRYWPFVKSPHKGQWRGALMFSLVCVWINDWVNNREAGDLRRHRGHYDVIVMIIAICDMYSLLYRCLFKCHPGVALQPTFLHSSADHCCNLHPDHTRDYATSPSGRTEDEITGNDVACTRWRHDIKTLSVLFFHLCGEPPTISGLTTQSGK